MKNIFKIVILIFVSLMLITCDSPFTKNSKDNKDNTLEGYGSLLLNFTFPSRVIKPDDPSLYTPVIFTVSGTGPSGATIPETEAGVFFYIDRIPKGTWSFTINGYNENGHLVAKKDFEVQVSGSMTKTIVLERISGTGSMDLSIMLGSFDEFDTISGNLVPQNGEASIPVNFTMPEENPSDSYPVVRCTKSSLSAGIYTLVLNLKKGGVVKDTITEAVTIYKDCTSVGTLARSVTKSNNLTITYDPHNPVNEIHFFDTQMNVDISNIPSGKQVYLVKVNENASPVSNAGKAESYSGLVAIPFNQPLNGNKIESKKDFAPTNRIIRKEHEAALAFNALPLLPQAQKNESKRSMRSMSNPQQSIGYGQSGTYTVGTSTKKFWVQNHAGQWVEKTATLRALGEYCYIWVANENYNNSSTVPNDNKITSEQAIALQKKFDGTSANSNNDGIFKNVTNIFGYEYGGGPGGDGGKDGDQHISILVYDIDGDYKQKQDSGIMGYFWGKDFYDQEEMTGFGLKTNNMEIFYVDAHFTDSASEQIFSTLAHEYQHMIHFARKAVDKELSSPTWFDEMCSMNAEDLVLENIELDPVTFGAQNRFPHFLYHYAESGISDWLGGNDVLKSYATSFAFGAFLSRTYGGATFYKALMNSDYTGASAISDAIAITKSIHGFFDDDFSSAMKRFGEALVFTHENTTTSTFNKEVIRVIDGIEYTAKAIDLSDIKQFDLYNGEQSSCGIKTYPVVRAVPLRPWGYSVHTETSWKNPSGGNLNITLTAPANGVRFFLMVK